MSDFPILVLKSGRDKSIRNRHPWIFSGAIKSVDAGRHGQIVEVRDNQGLVLGLGHYAPNTTLACRMFHFGELEGSLNGEYWKEKLRRARKMRYGVLKLGEADTTGYRLIHAEGDELPGVVLDIYGNAASIQLRTAGSLNLLDHIQEYLLQELGIEHIYLQTNKQSEVENGWVLGGIELTTFRENGMQFNVDIAGGQKTGFFLDQRDNRWLLKQYAKDKTILNAFSYSGAFSVAALFGGAKQVDSVDISSSAIDQANANISLNFPEGAPHEGIVADCFQYLKEMEADKYDLIILDPPAFTKHIKTVKKASRGYKDINMRAMRKIQSGGLLFTYSCSQHISRDLFRKIVFAAAADAGRSVQVLAQMEQAPDHPVSIYHPEGEYLKGLLLHIR